MKRPLLLLLCVPILLSSQIPNGMVLKNILGGTFTMGSNNLIGSPSQQVAAPEHHVTLSPFSIGETEVTNSQYVEFLNAAYFDGLIEIVLGTMGPDNGRRLIRGTTASNFSGKTYYSLDGIRVLKDHDDADGDGNQFTGDVEPENPLNISYIDFDVSSDSFYVKDPYNINDFNWEDICNYQDYGTTPMQAIGPFLNDFDDWSGSGMNYSSELQGWTSINPNLAVGLPTKSEVSNWPVTFIRWYGAKAFAEYYNLSLPTEAQWEFVAKGGQNFQYAVYDGLDFNDANWNQAGMGHLATGHVRNATSGIANPFGLYNLAGNVWEWMEDNYVEPYNTTAVTDPVILVSGSTSRCWRGGSWNYHQATLQSSIRFKDEENRGNDHFGFRVAGENTSVGLIKNQTKANISVFPNPSRDIFNITFTSEKKQDLEFRILNVVGESIYKEELKTLEGKYTKQLTLSDYLKGIYFLEIETDDGVINKKLILQ